MKKFLTILLTLILAICVIGLVACGDNKAGSTPDIHTHSYTQTVTAPTCTQKGYTTYTCTCGDNYKDNEIQALGHTFGSWIEEVSSTCVQAGAKAHKECSACHKNFDNNGNEIADLTIAINVTAHNIANGECSNCNYRVLYVRINESDVPTTNGEYILFGSYPQTDVTATMGETLENYKGTLPTSANDNGWIDYEYYIQNRKDSAFMWYKDVTHNNEMYRAVYFTRYRPDDNGTSSTNNSRQDDNDYSTNKVYWFKYEPIKWRILQEESGYATLLSEMIIDSQACQDLINNTYTSYYNISVGTPSETYANNYEYSTIRAWLNDNFYNTAFSSLEQAIIQTTTVDNSAETTSSSTNQYTCENTEDKVYLLSFQELIDENNGFNSIYNTEDIARKKKTTGYAKVQGAYTFTTGDNSGNGSWWLRSPYSGYSRSTYVVGYSGNIPNSYVDSTEYGVVPALKIKL